MTKQNHQLAAEVRTLTGRKVNKLRKEGIIPVSMYGHGFEPMTLQAKEQEIDAIFEEVGESGLVDVMVDGKKYPVLFKNPQYHPISGYLMHLDLHKVNLKEKITATVPVEFIGESPAVKLGNVLVEVTTEVEVEALPTELPEKFEVDLGKLETLENMITVADLSLPQGVEMKTALDQVIVKVEEPKEEVIEEPTVAPEEVPATEQKAPEAEGEAEKKEE